MREGGSGKWQSREVTCYVRKEGLIMRCWKPKNHVSDGEEVLQFGPSKPMSRGSSATGT